MRLLLMACLGCGGIVVPYDGPVDASPADGPFSDSLLHPYDAPIDVGGQAIHPKTVVASDVAPHALAVDHDWVYFTNRPNSVMKVKKAGGAPVILASNQLDPRGIAVDATHVYWVTHHVSLAASTLSRLPLQGGSTRVLVDGQSGCTDVALAGAHVYWTCPGEGRVKRALKDGTNVEILASNQDHPVSITVHGRFLLWVNNNWPKSSVVRADLDGRNPIVLRTSSQIMAAVTDGTSAYFMNSTGAEGVMERVAVWGGGPAALAKGAGGGGSAIAIDSTHLFFSWSGGEGLVKLPLAGGGPPFKLTQKVNGYHEATSAIALDDRNVYWVGLQGASPVSINVTPK